MEKYSYSNPIKTNCMKEQGVSIHVNADDSIKYQAISISHCSQNFYNIDKLINYELKTKGSYFKARYIYKLASDFFMWV